MNLQITDGANSKWTLETDGSIVIRGNGEFSKFIGVKVDGTLIDESNYTAASGSTIVTLKADYLNTLSEGSHTFEMLWSDGTASTNFTVAKNITDDNKLNEDDNKSDDNKSNGGKVDDIAGNKDSGNSNNSNLNNGNSESNTKSKNSNDASKATKTDDYNDVVSWMLLMLAGGAAVAYTRKQNSRSKQ